MKSVFYHGRMRGHAFVIFGLCLFATGCHKSDPYAVKQGPVQEWAHRQDKPGVYEAQAAQEMGLITNSVAFKMFASIDRPGENICISPVSLTMALAMMANGANGTTRDAIFDALGDKGGLKPVNDGMHDLMVELHSGTDCPITLSNSVWTVGNLTPLSPFKKALEDNYAAKVGSGLQTGAAGAKTINDWTAQVTGGLIDHVFDSLDGGTHSLIANAAVFECRWATEFDPKKTRNNDFKVSVDKTTSARFMTQEEQDYPTVYENDAQIIMLPYKAKDFAMVMMLPDKVTPEKFIASQTWESWGTMMGDLQSKHIFVQIPKMTIRAQYDLKPTLKKLGLGQLLDHADMSNLAVDMNAESISVAVQNTYVQVEEEGTQAAATTDVSTAGGTGENFVANRPFAYAIIHKKSGAILFLGVCNDPSAT